MSGMRLRKYGVEATIDFEVYEVDGVDLRVDWVPAQADCEIMKDGGASTLCDNTATDEGSTYSIVLTATEMQFARGVLKIVDAAAKVFLDTTVHIETYGNASAQHAFDLDDAVRGGMTALPNAAADGVGGLPISDAGGLDLDTQLATTDQIGAAGAGLTAINLPNQTMDIIGSITGNLSGSVGSVTGAVGSVSGDTKQTADHTAGIADIPTVAEFNARTLASADYVVTTDTIAGVTLVATTTTNTDMVGTDSAALASVCTEGRLAELDAANLPADVDAIKVVTDNLASSATTIVSGTVSHDNTVATTTIFFSNDITEATADHYKGRIIIFTSGAVQNQASDITAYALDTGEGKFTVTALTEAPADNVTFVIV